MRLSSVVLLLLTVGCDCGANEIDDAGADADVGFDSVLDVGVDATDTGADVNGDVSTDAIADTSDAELDASTTDCIGQPDFTPCRVVTDPDRDYDICVAETCVSPGCGDATCAPPGPSFVFADTGQRSCYDTTASIACPGASCAALCDQDAEHGWDVTNLMSARYVRTAPVADEPVVDDAVTGLSWQGCSRGTSGPDCETGVAAEVLWADALSYCDELSWGGFDDWRLPDVLEAHSIMDYDQDAGVTISAFPNAPMLRHFTSTSWAGGDDAVWIAPFSGVDGELGVILPASASVSTGAVRCVRTGSRRTFPAVTRSMEGTVPDEPVVVDESMGRLVQGCARGQSGAACVGDSSPGTWSDALAYCAALVWGGHDDWRLPTSKSSAP